MPIRDHNQKPLWLLMANFIVIQAYHHAVLVLNLATGQTKGSLKSENANFNTMPYLSQACLKETFEQ